MAGQKPKGRGNGPKLTSGKGGKSSGSRAKRGPAAVSPKKDAHRHRRPSKRRAHPGKPRLWKRRSFWTLLGSLCFTMLLMGFAVLLYFAHDLPDIQGIDTIDKQPGITMKTRDGLIIASYGDVYGDYIEYDELPAHLIKAVLATEDRRFFEHPGIDIFGIMRAMLANLRAGAVMQGGSTITQQVAKNVFLTPERTVKRKIQEMLLAFWLEGRFTKQEILAIYLNRVYLGAGTYGIDAASEHYFDKPATEVNLIESAVLTGLLKAPSRYSPIANAELAKKRAHQVLLNMVDAGMIDRQRVQQALTRFQPPTLYRADNPSGTRYFTDWLIDELPEYLGQIEQDLVVITTLDPTLQKEAEDAVGRLMDERGETKNASQASLVAMSPQGAVRAMVGGRDYGKSQFNRVTQARRQPGSVFKLFVYLAALDAGMTPDTLITDEPVEYEVGSDTWTPRNFSGDFRGTVTMREALTHSLNTVAVQLAMAVGIPRVADMARRLGLPHIEANPSIALGAVEATLLDLTAAYAHLANQGRGVQPYGVEAIYAQSGEELYARRGSGLWVVLRDSVVSQMNYMLMNVPVNGTGRAAAIGRPMAGKTGTSSEFKDAWFIGFVPQLVTGVWIGNDDNTPMKNVTGGSLPARIWQAFMSQAVQGLPIGVISASEDAAGRDHFLPWNAPPRSIDEFTDEQPASASPDSAQNPNRTFWDKLFEQEGDVEYDYPTSGRR